MSQLVACPECKKHLQVPVDLLGKKVQCPECKHTFTARSPEEEAVKTSTTVAPPPSSKSAAWDKKSKADDDEEEEDRTTKSIKKKRRDYDDDDDEDDDDDRRSRRRKRSSSRRGGGSYEPHRGGMILAFGLLGLVLGFTGLIFPVVFAILAWIMGHTDLTEMRAGRMDPEGEGMTQAGRILGIIGVVLHVLYVLGICAYFAIVFIFVAAIVGAGANRGPRQPRGGF